MESQNYRVCNSYGIDDFRIPGFYKYQVAGFNNPSLCMMQNSVKVTDRLKDFDLMGWWDVWILRWRTPTGLQYDGVFKTNALLSFP